MHTYMPRNISISKKYLPARSSELSPSSQCLRWGNRKPAGGGPEGVAAREVVELKKATVAGAGSCARNWIARRSAGAPRERASASNGVVVAIVCASVEWSGGTYVWWEVDVQVKSD
jgi:hypothetical protein